jgi:UDP-N-acetylmuramoyl-tripeptide--D-alanyl-D-alanine ligase
VNGIIVEEGRLHYHSMKKTACIIEVPDCLTALGDLAGYWRKQHKVLVAAITGSAGKTSVKEMTASILGREAKTLKNKGNLNNLIGMPLTILEMEEEDRMAVLEMGMNRPGEIARLTEIADPDVGLINNVARAHLEGLGDIMGVARAKTELIEKISQTGKVVLNGDDEFLMKAASYYSREIITFGLSEGNDIRAGNIRNMGINGMSFNLLYQGDSIPLRITVPGLQNVSNSLAASAIGICMNIPFDQIRKGLEEFEGIEGRFRIIPLIEDIILIDDTYNSNPLSLKAAIDSVSELAAGRRIIIGLGEMLELGDETVKAHFEAGEKVAKLGGSYLFVIGDHAADVLDGAVKNGLSRGKSIMVESYSEMAQKIDAILEKGDLILLKGSRRIGLDRVSEYLKKRR